MIVKILKIVCYIILAWVVISYIDVIIHNINSYHYQPWNFFEILAKSILTN